MSPGLDQEKAAKYKLTVEAADINGEGLHTLTTAIIDVSKDYKIISNSENIYITTDIAPNDETVDITKAAPATNLKFELFRKDKTPSHITVWKVLSGDVAPGNGQISAKNFCQAYTDCILIPVITGASEAWTFFFPMLRWMLRTQVLVPC
ncbi:B-cadherin-like [Polypterus senegalus]|uniref:B-cadherin-like n=1 Tax=Polypterus senegalus TaxID=55291 RepID=UPI001966CCB2|nr:B-cadherin-like [Polypterus senegalus]